jgi:hypothetical protein
MSAYDSKTIAQVIYDFAVIRGDLSERYARDQLVRIIEDRIAAARVPVRVDNNPMRWLVNRILRRNR